MSEFASQKFFWAVLAYVFLVLLVDTLAAQDVELLIDWDVFSWRFDSRGPWAAFDLYKFLLWLLLPLTICLPRMDWAWLSWRGMQQVDWLLMLGVAVAGALAMALIPFIPGLQQQYPSLSLLPQDVRIEQFQMHLIWTFSWLLGWEFLHRYCLLKVAVARFPVWGWCLVPLSEGLYHLQKPPLEALGMVMLSVFLTKWTLKRGTLLPALLAHFLIELELMAYQLL